MRCRRAQQLILRSKEHPLDGRAATGLATHLGGCLRCREGVARADRAMRALDLLPVTRPRPDFTGRLMSRLPEQGSGWPLAWSAWREALRPVPLAMAGVSLVFGVMLATASNGRNSSKTVAQPANPVETLYAESFDLMPANSVGAGYLALHQEGDE